LDVLLSDAPASDKAKQETTLSSLGPLKDAEKRDLNCAVKEYLLFAGYRLTAMTFIEEVMCLQSLSNFEHRMHINHGANFLLFKLPFRFVCVLGWFAL
jgi:hypothetical protein